MEKKTIRGAYDKDGQWWHESDIKSFTHGMIMLHFGVSRSKITIIKKPV